MRFTRTELDCSTHRKSLGTVAQSSLLAILLVLTASGLSAEEPAGPSAESAAGDNELWPRVSALITQKCGSCHTGAEPKGSFNLETRESLVESGFVQPGSATDSWVMQLIRHEEEPAMPLKADKLADGEIALIEKWIDAGAPYQTRITASPAGAAAATPTENRAFKRLEPVTPPDVGDSKWCQTPIDNFVRARLESAGIEPNEPAEMRTLLRRLYFDVIGLPPEPEVLESLEREGRSKSYEELVDLLLANPHYGERWARHWLDIVRFAESHGFEHDHDRPSAYHYRDFVIRALNEDMPFDQFVEWQIAGDELAPQDPQALMATGFLAAGVHNTQITANQVEKERYDELDDIVNTIGTSMLGLTVGCARCHDHKFDPIPTTDYYKLVATFTTCVRSEVELELDAEKHRVATAAYARKLQPVAAELEQFEKQQLPLRFDRWLSAKPDLSALGDQLPTWAILDPLEYSSQGYKDTQPAVLRELADHSLVAAGPSPIEDEYTVVAETELPSIRAIRIEALSDGSLPLGGPGRAGNGNFALSDFTVAAGPRDESAGPVDVELADAEATFQQNDEHLSARAAIDDDPRTGWAVDHGGIGQDQALVLHLARPISFPSGARLTLKLKFKSNAQHTLGRCRVSITTDEGAAAGLADELPQKEQEALAGVVRRASGSKSEPLDLTTDDRAALQRWFASTDPDWRALKEQVRELQRQEPRPAVARVLICSEGVEPLRLATQGADFFEQTYVLRRGDPNQKVEPIAPGFLHAVTDAQASADRWAVARPPEARTSFHRARLANWLTDVDHGAGHLLARVIVNRLWQHHFGKGIVGSPSDFGLQGEPATHPELLDWLALELIRNEWRLKPIHRLILTSAAYRQSARFEAHKSEVDPTNALLWRYTPRRLEGETIRDSILAVSGDLDATIFGPGSKDAGHSRRGIYFFLKRSQMPRMLSQFDGPDALGGLPSRATTTVAPQALLLLNSDQVWKWSRDFAGRLAPFRDESATVAIEHGYLLAVGRRPTAEETQASLQFLVQQLESYRERGSAEADQLAWTDFCQALFCLNEFAYVE